MPNDFKKQGFACFVAEVPAARISRQTFTTGNIG
jgi:hypothetical protein